MNAKSNSRTSQANLVICAFVVVAALRIGRDVLMPFALAVLLSFLLMPLVVRLQRRLGRIIAVIFVSATAFTSLAGASWLVSRQVADLAEELPVYHHNIRGKIKALRESFDSTIGWASRTTDAISKELATDSSVKSAAEPAAEPAAVSAAEPSPPVATTLPSPGSGRSFLNAALTSTAGSMIVWLGRASVIILLVFVILITYDDLRDRFLSLVGTGRLNVTTHALGDAADRVSRYLLMQTIISISHGVLVGTGLYFLGLPAALFWGLNSALLRYLPYLGPVLAAALPIGLALAVSDNWTLPLMTIGFFIVLELVSNNILEPWLFSRSTGLSPLAVVVAAVFWTWLWGWIGLILSAPLTVCLVVLGKHVVQLRFLNVLLGDEPMLDPKHRLYQRLLALDHDGALEVAEMHLESRSLEEVYDQVFAPALAMFEFDRHSGELEEMLQKFILENMRDIIEELDVVERKRRIAKELEVPKQASSARSTTPVSVLCLPAHDEADELAGAMFVQILERDGHRARCLSIVALAGEVMDLVEKEAVQIVCISAVPPSAVLHARYLCKRLRSRFEQLNIVVCVWTAQGDPQRLADRVKQDDRTQAVTTLAAGRELVRQLAKGIVLRSSAEATARTPSR